MPDPIEISAKDLIERPVDWTAAAAAGKKSGMISQFKEVMALIKEIKGVAADLEGLGVNIPGLLGGASQNEPTQKAIENQPKPTSPTDQLRLIAQVLRMKYGDVTVNDLVERLKKDYGNKKLSSF